MIKSNRSQRALPGRHFVCHSVSGEINKTNIIRGPVCRKKELLIRLSSDWIKHGYLTCVFRSNVNLLSVGTDLYPFGLAANLEGSVRLALY